MNEHYQIAIIGAGPAGLAAACRAASQNISHLLIEKEELGNTIYNYQLRKHVMDEPARLPLRSELPFRASSREAVLDTWQNTIKNLGVRVKKAEITKIKKEGTLFEISFADRSCTADNVILAIGLQGSPRKLEMPGGNLPHVSYTLSDPDAFKNEDIIIVGAGDSAIENALALASNNRVFLLNRSADFARAKDANASLIQNAIQSGKIKCYYNSTISRVEKDVTIISAPDGDVQVKTSRIIARLGAVLPRKFLESCGIVFSNADPQTVPIVSEKYESNVPGLFLIGSLIGYPLIKQGINQGYEVVEHILGRAVEPADQGLIEEKLKVLSGSVKENLEKVQAALPLFSELSVPQFRELILESTIHLYKKESTVFKLDDYGDTLFSVISGSVVAETQVNKNIEIEEGNYFGEMGLLSGRKRLATIRTGIKGQSILLETPRKQILKLISSVESVKRNIDQTFALRMLLTSIFHDASFQLNQELVEKSRFKSFKKGEVLFKEGDEADFLYVIRKGSVKIAKKNLKGNDIAQTYISAGNYVGEMGLLEIDGRRNATVSAAVPCEMLVIEKVDFLNLLEKSPKTRDRVIRLVQERKIQNNTGFQETTIGLMLDFILKEGVSDAENVLIIDSDRCIGCDNCEKACAATHGGSSRLDRKGGKSFAAVQLPISCRHCENPLCMIDCPPDALVRRSDGEVIIKDSCIGCGNCEKNCPYGVIQMVYPDKGFSLLSLLGLGKKEKGSAKAAKCDLCEVLSGGPACVRSCPTGAAMRISPEQFEQLISERKK